MKSSAKRGMSLLEYQSAAAKTDHTGIDPQDGTLVSVLGIVGEAGDLATLFKKKLRDGDAFTVYPAQCAEELGDILWYVATLCSKLGLSLDEIARGNLAKTASRWQKFTKHDGPRRLFDEGCDPKQQIPRRFVIHFSEESLSSGTRVILTREGKPIGDALSDNSYVEDGYRFHDVFHLSYAAVLGWSPVTRKLLGCKRRENKQVDEIEDGGRASVIEEGISALVFQYAKNHNLFDGVGRVDSELLSLITRLASGFEASEVSAGEWELAILEGYKAFRLLNREHGGIVTADLSSRSLTYAKLPTLKK